MAKKEKPDPPSADDAQSEELTALQAAHEKVVTELNAAHESRVDELQQQHDRELAELRDTLPTSPHDGLKVEVRKDVRCGGETLVPGEPVALMQLRPGVSFNWLIDAARNGFVRECHDE